MPLPRLLSICDRMATRVLIALAREGGPIERTEQALRHVGHVVGEATTAVYGPVRNSVYKASLALHALRRPQVPVRVTSYEVPAPPPGTPLHIYTPHPHVLRHPTDVHKAEQQEAGINTRIAVWLTKQTGTMQTAYIFTGIGVGSLIGVFTNNVFLAALFGSISSYFLQLVLLPVLSVGQNVLARHQEIQADEMYHGVVKLLDDQSQAQHHLAAQDTELLRQTALLVQLVGALVPSAVPSAAGQVALANESIPPTATEPTPEKPTASKKKG